MIELALLGWVLLAIRYPAYRLPRSRSGDALVGLYLLAMVLATVVGVSPQRSLWSNYERMMGLFDMAHWFLLIVVTAAMFRSWDALAGPAERETSPSGRSWRCWACRSASASDR